MINKTIIQISKGLTGARPNKQTDRHDTQPGYSGQPGSSPSLFFTEAQLECRQRGLKQRGEESKTLNHS